MDSATGSQQREIYEYWFELVAQLMSTRMTQLPYGHLAHALNRTFGAAGTAVHQRGPNGVRQEIHRPDGPRPGDDLLNDFAVARAPREHPLLRFYLATGDFPVLQIRDVPDRYADEALKAAWFELTASDGHGHQIALCTPTGPTGSCSLVVGRGEPYSPAEMQFAERLRAVLVGLTRHAAADRAWQSRPAAHTGVSLSARESVVLAGIARGLTAEAIGRELVISPRTVQKHLERTYAKLEVRDRVSAVLRARTLGII